MNTQPETLTFNRPPVRRLEHLAPVAGGIRWRRPCHDIIDACRRSGGFTIHDPENPVATGEPYREPEAILAPLLVTTPPGEGRAGEEYVYRPRAIDSVVDGFTWRLGKAPPGMAIDRYTGKVSWTPPEGGYVEVVIHARSLYGTEASQSWTICVRKAAPVRAVTPNLRYREALRRKALRPATPFRQCWRVPAGRKAAEIAKTAETTEMAITGRLTAAPPAARSPVAFPLRR